MTLDDVARAFRAALPKDGRVEVFRIDAMDRLGVPVCEAALLPADGGPATIGYGYGMTPVEAEVGALGELLEEACCGDFLHDAPRVAGSFAELRRARGEDGVLDPLTLCLPAGSNYTPDMPLSWIEGRWHDTGAPVLIPLDWVGAYPYQLGEAPRLVMPITNGLGAGFDLPHAIAHGVMELLQRDGNVLTYRALDQGVVVEPDRDCGEDVAAILKRLRDAGIGVTVKLAASEFGLANLYVVGDDPGAAIPIQLTACGEAAHPDLARGLRKALLEFCGSRSRKSATHGPVAQVRAAMPPEMAERQFRNALAEEQEERPVLAMAEWLAQDAAELRARLSGSVFAEKRRAKLSNLPDAGPGVSADSAARLAWLSAALAAEGMRVAYVDLSPPGGEVRVVKTVVPGLESETMSYARLGWRGVRKLRARGDALLLDAARDGALPVRLRPEDEARAGGPAWFDKALAERLVAKLYPLYREPGPFSAQLTLAAQRGAA